jgi:hypothetical protein
MKWLGIICTAVLLAGSPHYASAQQPKNESAVTLPQGPEVKEEPAETVKSFTPAERKAYEKKTGEELDAIQGRIAEFRMKAATGAPNKKRLLLQAAKNLQLQQVAASTELTALKKASGAAWGPQKAKVDKSMEGLRKALEPAPTQTK